MNLPRWLFLFFSETFTGTQVEILNKNWYNYSYLSPNNSSREELLEQARVILSIVKS